MHKSTHSTLLREIAVLKYNDILPFRKRNITIKAKTTERFNKLHLTHLISRPKQNWLPVSSLIVFGSCFLIFSYMLGCPRFFFNLLCFAIFIKLLTNTDYFHSKKRKKKQDKWVGHRVGHGLAQVLYTPIAKRMTD